MSDIVRKKINIKGIVQGVGFRPFIYKIAIKNNISGNVSNNTLGVTVESEGIAKNIDSFINEIGTENPKASRIDSLEITDIPVKGETGFNITESKISSSTYAVIPPDLALCGDCRNELEDKNNKRYLYPFTNCTNCGPRFTIVKTIPYDRPKTTMSEFKMCPDCLREYRNPCDRRFHAQPNACPVCGPEVRLIYGKTELKGLEALKKTASLIILGKIGLIQSLGGFHLCCRADFSDSVKRLRRFKKRPYKPFAVMTYSVAEAKKICRISAIEENALKSAVAPIVMLKRKDSSYENCAPNLSKLGVMIAYTPLHAALFKILKTQGFNNPLVMTSGNFSEEPVCKDINEMSEDLKKISDFILYNNRPIHNRIDDSVVYACDGKIRLLRRARGYVPVAIKLKKPGNNILAGGADLKNTFCLVRNNEAFLSQHIGDLSEVKNQDFYKEALSNISGLLRIKPKISVCDKHPNYASSKIIGDLHLNETKIQHHFAHALSVAAENGLTDNFLALTFDGTGYGNDGNIWGSEFLLFKKGQILRKAHLKYFRLPGGDISVHEIWRSGLSVIKDAYGADWKEKCAKLFKYLPNSKFNVVNRMIETGINSPFTCGAGRLFDAFAFIAGIRDEATYEGQASCEMETLLKGSYRKRYDFFKVRKDDCEIIDYSKAVKSAVEDKLNNVSAKEISFKFINGLLKISAETAVQIAKESNISNICLSGGVFQNVFFSEELSALLRESGFNVHMNEFVPTNDGGISLGQAYFATLPDKISF